MAVATAASCTPLWTTFLRAMVPSVRKILRALVDPVELAILAAPPDNEPETEKERASVASSLADGSPDIPFEQLRRIRA